MRPSRAALGWLAASVVAIGCGGGDKRPGKRGPKRDLKAAAAAQADRAEGDGGDAGRRGDDGEPTPEPTRLAPRRGLVTCPSNTEHRGGGAATSGDSYCITVEDGQPIKHGPYREWRPDGTLKLEGEYDRGKKSDLWQVYREDGTLDNESTYDDGELHGPWTTYHPNGQKSGEGRYDRGKKTGSTTFWYDNGQMKAQSTYAADLREGRSVNWYRDGAVAIAGRLRRGQEGRPVDGVLAWRRGHAQVVRSRRGDSLSYPNGSSSDLARGPNTSWPSSVIATMSSRRTPSSPRR